MKPCVILLGAGAPPNDNQPFGVQQVTMGRRILDWQLEAFAALRPEVHFVGGYEIELVQKHFPRLTYHHNINWRETGSVASLALALQEIRTTGDIYIAYADILLRPALVQSLANADAGQYCIACDMLGAQQTRPPERIGDREFVGLVRVPAALVQSFISETLRVAAVMPRAHLSQLFLPFTYTAINAHGLWAHAEFGRSVARFVMGSKATTLERLQSRLTCSSILPLYYFTRRQYQESPDTLVAAILQQLTATPYLVVRSSATDEDGFTRANAGKYHSELNVAPQVEALHAAIERVFASYTTNDANDEVLVQPQLTDVVASGVVFTRMLEHGAPYYVINYVLGSDTTAITAGTRSEHIKKYVARCAPESIIAALPARIQNILRAVREIEQCVCYDALDIEFALDSSEALTTLQVRPLMIDDMHQDREVDAQVKSALNDLYHTLQDFNATPQGQSGNHTAWSVMADWNPAEIVGITPALLALDLYRHLISDTTWAQQRYAVGYRDVRNWPLIRSFAGHAFVDVRASLNSFIPACLPESQAELIVNAALYQLHRHREWHDKVEFELLPTCLDFDFAKWEMRYPEVISPLWREGLRTITRTIIARSPNDVAAAESLEAQCTILEQQTEPVGDWLWHCLHHAATGALTFAHLARAGFVAASLLRSAIEKNLLSADRAATLMESIEGVGHLFTNAAAEVREERRTRTDFIARFGHLRPGTYDIATPAYRAAPEYYIDPVIASARTTHAAPFAWTIEEKTILDEALKPLDIGLDAMGMLSFITRAVAGREYAKFVFTRLLSAALDGLEAQGKAMGISNKYLPAMPLKQWFEGANSEVIVKETHARYRAHRLAGSITLPSVMMRPEEIYAFEMPPSDPTFITTRKTRAVLRVVETGKVVQRAVVEGTVVAIVNADPGFDYLFSLGICGLITAYGGPNSHMAIRACEYGIPAVIGIGEEGFTNLRDGALVEVDCAQRRLWVEGL
ncbi:MAG: PEP/pyruvate-binding domain-containing protein [Alphaproteobacteria bacterium]